jgi:hypothetical protein
VAAVSPVVRLWMRSAAAALVVAALAALLPLAPALRARTGAELARLWLLTVWTAGVLAILFGAAGWISGFRGLGFRDVASAGSVQAAAERKKAGALAPRGFAPGVVTTGVVLIAIYFAGWLALRGR